jgi:hypothetical protein
MWSLLRRPRLCSAAVAALLALVGSSALADVPKPAVTRRLVEPVLFVMQLSPDAHGAPWGLAIGKDRSARVTIKGTDHKITLTEAAFTNLLNLMKSERFSQLEESYGTPAVDRDYRVIDAWIDGRKKSVFLYSDLAQDPRGDEVARALRVWIAVRDLFDIPGAIDTRPQDRVLAERKESTTPQ